MHTGMGARLHLACALISVLPVHGVCGPLNAQPKQDDPWELSVGLVLSFLPDRFEYSMNIRKHGS